MQSAGGGRARSRLRDSIGSLVRYARHSSPHVISPARLRWRRSNSESALRSSRALPHALAYLRDVITRRWSVPPARATRAHLCNFPREIPLRRPSAWQAAGRALPSPLAQHQAPAELEIRPCHVQYKKQRTTSKINA
ncbi:hypothetical protein NDU88_011147 [Pleurodeles waltl]|uniref:Uncharacterized protein n=1 Tax=Pleurodeles waltl TaxID=8319 RepID=A0AAV7S0A3_PLEWA|nr:hypothetical protein NDU88_011147 [Pleurodeles waltl]